VNEPPAPSGRRGLGYLPWMDGMRAIAVMAVMVFHELLYAPQLASVASVVGGGEYGVDIFFAVSGFLITTLLLQEVQARGGIRFGAFYLRRARRLLPALGALLLVITLGALILQRGHHRVETLENVGWAASYVGNWVKALTNDTLAELGHTWSLAIEEQFYLLWPLTLTVLISLGLRGRRLLGAIAVLVAATLVWPQVGVSRGWGWNRFYYGLDTHAAPLAIGAVLAVAFVEGLLPRHGSWPSWRHALGVVGALVVLATLHDPGDIYRLSRPLHLVDLRARVSTFAIVGAGTTLVIWELLESAPHLGHRILSWPPLVAIGRVSYGLYLWDAAVVWGLTPSETGISDRWLLAGVHVVVVTAAALTSWFFVERWFRTPRPQAVPLTVAEDHP
jgi:peptidoglycan/LPS O-acetylase OafA/YrhL